MNNIGEIEDAMKKCEQIAAWLGNTDIRLQLAKGKWRTVETMRHNGYAERSPPFDRPTCAVEWLLNRLTRIVEKCEAAE